MTPHQQGSGDPSPNNVRSINGYTVVNVTRAGKNILPNQLQDATISGNTYVKNADGSVTVSGTVENQNNVRQIINNLPIANGNYILSGGTEHVRMRVNRYNLNGDLIDRVTDTGSGAPFTVDDTIGRIYVGVNPYPTGEIINNVTVYPMIRLASIADDTYEPYQGETYTITIPTAAGTVYGGSLTVEQDRSGTLTVDRAYIKATTQNIAHNNNTSWYVISSDSLRDGVVHPIKSNVFAEWESGVSTIAPGVCFLNGLGSLRFNTVDSYDTANDLLTAIPDIEFVYPLAEPQTYTLTTSQIETLLGDNAIFMDADGTIDLVYRADTQKYIDSRISALSANLAYIEGGTTASRVYTVGQFVLIGGQLYRVTSAISSGATFTIGTNVVPTTVGAELTALNN